MNSKYVKFFKIILTMPLVWHNIPNCTTAYSPDSVMWCTVLSCHSNGCMC